eukprot:COSAG02_NODE_48699_length_332_cov_0.570815_1_plen_44_part_10
MHTDGARERAAGDAAALLCPGAQLDRAVFVLRAGSPAGVWAEAA